MRKESQRRCPLPLPLHIGLMASQANFAEGGKGAQSYQDALLGMQRYIQSDYVVERNPVKPVWSCDGADLLKLQNAQYDPSWPVFLLVPSLINRSYIFNLMKEQSFAQYFSENKCNIYILDWGGLQNQNQHTMEFLIQEQIVHAANFLCERYSQEPHVLGYCMGGTMLAASAFFKPENFASLVFLAAPWDFHVGDKPLYKHVRFWAPMICPNVDESGFLTSTMLQSFFAGLAPDKTLQKFEKFYKLKEGSLEEAVFIALEDWLNDAVSLPGPIAQDCIQSWYLENKTAQNQWQVGPDLIDPSQIQIPSLVIASKRDSLVPFQSSYALHDRLKASQFLEVDTGHLGMMAGQKAQEKIWRHILQWVQNNST